MNRFPGWCYALSLSLGLSLVCAVVSAKDVASTPGSYLTARAVTLTDSRGGEVKLADLQGDKILVVAVLGTECPLVKLNAAKLQQLATDYSSKGVVVVGINGNRHDSLSEIASFGKQLQLTIPLLKDPQQKVIEAIAAQRTPEFFVIDAQGQIRYRGRFDDQHGIGKSRPEPTQHDLRNALDEVLAGKAVSVKQTTAVGCLITKQRAVQADSKVTYSKDIAPLLQKHCVECHRPGEIGPFSLTDYQEVAGWAEMLAEVTTNRTMPPWHADPQFGKFRNEHRLTDTEVKTIQTWVAAGAPEGNRADLPAPRKFTEGWQLPREPDQVVYIADKPVPVKSSGEMKYQFFTVDPGFKEETWISAAEVVPGCRAVVHHVIVFAAASERRLDPERQFLCAFVPGLRLDPLPTGIAKKIPAGSKLIFQMHYTPIGTPQEDRTKIGLIFADSKTITHEVRTESVGSINLRIRPRLKDQKFESKTMTAPTELQLLSLSPHMHLRGQSFRYELTWPDGKMETLLNVPNYDFNWQTSYRLNEPLRVPKGATLQAFATYDNSAENLANPDPSRTVTWGDQSWDEMFLGYFDIAIAREEAALVPQQVLGGLVQAPDPEKAIGNLMKLFDKNQDGKISRNEVGERQKAAFNLLDLNHDDEVTPQEAAKALKQLRERRNDTK